MMDISILIVSHGHENFLPRLFESLQNQEGNIDFEVLLLHNLPTNFENLRKVKQFYNKRPTGLAENLNRLIDETQSPVSLILNPDTFLPKNCLQHCLASLKNNHILSCHSIHPNGHRLVNLRQLPTLKNLFYEYFFNSSVRNLKQLKLENSTLHNCWFQGSFIMTYSSILRTIRFDPEYELYFEDVDFFQRAQKQNFALQYLTDMSYFHHHQKASRQLFSEEFYLHCRSALRYFFGL